MSGDVRQSRPVVRDRVTLVAGKFQGDWFEIERRPSGDFGREEWGEHKMSMQREWERRRLSKELGLLPSYKTKNEGVTEESP